VGNAASMSFLSRMSVITPIEPLEMPLSASMLLVYSLFIFKIECIVCDGFASAGIAERTVCSWPLLPCVKSIGMSWNPVSGEFPGAISFYWH
jgi:hypothetical protein